jgi:Right handed beta helix region
MRHRYLACGIALAVLLLGISSIGALADTDLDAIKSVIGLGERIQDTMQAIGQVLSEARIPLVQAVSFVGMGMHSLTPEDMRFNAHAILNLLEGSESELFDLSVEIAGGFAKGLRPLLEQLTLTEQEWDDATPGSSGFGDGFDRFLSLLRLASEALQAGLLPDRNLSDLGDAFLIAFALLETVQDGIQGMLSTWGFEVWVSPGESIQAAIDAAREGAVIYIEYGVYRESLEITKSLTLDGLAWASLISMGELSLKNARMGYATTIQPVGSQSGITIRAMEPIQVTLRHMTVKGASNGILIEGASQVTIESVDVVESVVGVTVVGSASLVMSTCYVELDEVAILATGSSVVGISDCFVQYNTDTVAAIHVSEDAYLEMTNTEVYNNGGHGILVQDQAELILTDSLITYNHADGIHLTGRSTLTMNGTSCFGNAGFGIRALTGECPSDDDVQYDEFVGSVVGEANFLPVRGELGGNRQEGMCPESLRFLTDRPE